MMSVFSTAGYRPRISLGWGVSMVLGLVLVAGWFISILVEESAQLHRRDADRQARWDGAELVRICAGGERVFRLNHRLVVAHRWTGEPVQFAADVTPEAACVR